ncbi:MAG: hypothetical protein ACR2KV_09315 [Solirubrobacteraceae bacterium]
MARTPATRAGTGAGPAVPSGYAGLGARNRVFAAAHLESARGRGAGVPLVSNVAVDPADRVTDYTVQFNDRPPLSDFERLAEAAGVADLPRDRSTITRAAVCLVFGSPALKRLIGLSFVRVTTTPGTATARVEGVAKPGC